MTLDFRASQFRGAKFITSGSTGTGAKILFYDIAADSVGNPNVGEINTAKFVTTSIGTDVFMYVSGGINSAGVANSNGTTVFGGDVVVSGNLTLSGSLLSEVWIDGGNKARTTSSIAIGAGNIFASDVSAGVVFYVSGAAGGGFGGSGDPNANRFAVLPDTAISGNILMVSSGREPTPKVYGPFGTSALVFSQSSLVLVSVGGKIIAGNNSDQVVGSDVTFFVSGVLNGNVSSNKIVLPDTAMSGNLWFKSSSINSIPLIFNGPRDAAIAFSASNVDFIIGAGSSSFSTGFPVTYPGRNVFLYISGTAFTPSARRSVFSGDTQISGNLYLDGNYVQGAASPPGLFFVSNSSGNSLEIWNEEDLGWSINVPGNIGAASAKSLNMTAPYGDMGLQSSGAFVMSATDTVTGIMTIFAGAGLRLINNTTLSGSAITGSLQRTSNGRPYLTGSGLTFNTNSFGQIVVTSSYKVFMPIGSYISTTLTASNPQVAGQAVLSQSELPNTDIRLRSILSTTSGSTTASLQLYNLTSGSYVHIGGAGITSLFTLSQTPIPLTSVNLLGATNFGTGSSVYEVQVFIQTGSQNAILGSSIFVCT